MLTNQNVLVNGLGNVNNHKPAKVNNYRVHADVELSDGSIKNENCRT